MSTISKRIDAVTAIPWKYKREICPAPPSVKVELTSRCNYKCEMCAHKSQEKQAGDMPLELFKKITKDMREAGVQELGLFYIGESFLYPHLAEAVEYAKQELEFPYVFLTTNGSLATKRLVKKVMEAGLDSLKFSYNHSNDNQFRAITHCSPEKFEKVKKNIKDAYDVREKGGFHTKLYASSIMYDGEQGEQMKQAVERITPFVDEHYWLPLYSFGDQARIEGKEPTVGNRGRLEAMRDALPCWAVFREGHVTHEGLMSACCFDSSNRWIMGDLKERGFMDVWNGKEYQKLRAAHLSEDVHGTACETCIHGVEDGYAETETD